MYECYYRACGYHVFLPSLPSVLRIYSSIHTLNLLVRLRTIFDLIIYPSACCLVSCMVGVV